MPYGDSKFKVLYSTQFPPFQMFQSFDWFQMFERLKMGKGPLSKSSI
jgi:hypothetical protein